MSRKLNLGAISKDLKGGFTPVASSVSSVLKVSLDLLLESPQQLRIDAGDIEGLASSMHQHGLLQPVSVSPIGGGKYHIVAGHQRVAAARSLGWHNIDAFVVSAGSDGELALKGLIENIQRNDLSPLELALGIDRAMAASGLGVSAFALAIGKKPEWVSKLRSILSLPQEVLDALALEMLPEQRRRLGMEALSELSRVDDDELVCELFGKLRSGELNREGMREAIRAAKEPKVYETTIPMPTATVADLPPSYTLDEILEDDPLELLEPTTDAPMPKMAELVDNNRISIVRPAVSFETTVPVSEVVLADETPKAETIGEFWSFAWDKNSLSYELDMSDFNETLTDQLMREMQTLFVKYENMEVC